MNENKIKVYGDNEVKINGIKLTPIQTTVLYELIYGSKEYGVQSEGFLECEVGLTREKQQETLSELMDTFNSEMLYLTELKDKKEWEEPIWIATVEDIALAYRKTHKMTDDEPFTEEQEERIFRIAENAKDSLAPYDWDYQVQVFVEESERWMNEG